MAFIDPFEALFSLQRALDARRESDWLQDQTANQGPFPPINVFQQGSDLLAIVELPGVEKSSLQIEDTSEALGRRFGDQLLGWPNQIRTAISVRNESSASYDDKPCDRSRKHVAETVRVRAAASRNCSRVRAFQRFYDPWPAMRYAK